MTIHKIPATPIDNKIAQDNTLSYAALGLYVYLSSLPNRNGIANKLCRINTNQKQVGKLTKELIAHNLIDIGIE